MIKCIENILAVDLNDIKYDDLVSMKLSTIDLLNMFEQRGYCQFTNKHIGLKTELRNFNSFGRMAYGFINDYQWSSIVADGFRCIEEVNETISEHFLLENISSSKSLRFSPRVLSKSSPVDFKRNLENFKSVLEDYLSILHDESGEGYDVRQDMVRNVFRVDQKSNQIAFATPNSYNIGTVINETQMKIETFFYRNWSISTSKEIINPKNEMFGEFKGLIKKVYPEWYL